MVAESGPKLEKETGVFLPEDPLSCKAGLTCAVCLLHLEMVSCGRAWTQAGDQIQKAPARGFQAGFFELQGRPHLYWLSPPHRWVDSWLLVPLGGGVLALSSEHKTPSNCGTPCRLDVPWQDRYPYGCGAVQLLGAGGALAGCVLSNLTLRCSLPTWVTCLLRHRSKDGSGLTVPCVPGWPVCLVTGSKMVAASSLHVGFPPCTDFSVKN